MHDALAVQEGRSIESIRHQPGSCHLIQEANDMEQRRQRILRASLHRKPEAWRVMRRLLLKPVLTAIM